MPISVECPACEHEFNIPNSYGGKKGKCPECGKIFVAPSANSKTPAPQPPLPEKSSTAPVRPPQQVVSRFGSSAVAEPPAETMLTAPPVTEDSAFLDRPVQPPPMDDEPDKREQVTRRSTSKPLWIAFGVLSAMLLIGMILVIKSFRLDGKEVASDGRDIDQQRTKSQKSGDSSGKTATETPILSVPTKVNLKDLQLDQMWEKSHPAIYRIVAKGGEANSSGFAFMIDERGWLATSYQLIKAAESVDVFALNDPSAEGLPSKGIVALSPEHNVAIIAIEPRLGASLSLDVTTPKIDQELAICRSSSSGPLQLVQGYFARLRSFDDLTPNSRAVAQQQGLDRTASLFWLEHDQPFPSSDNGAPLLNADGNVIGINTSLSPDSKTGFALPAAYLLELVESADDNIAPFGHATTQVAANEKPAFEPGSVAPGDVPKPPARPEPGSLESVDVIRELHATCKDINWRPESAEEYELFQELAEYIYVAKVNEVDERIEEGLRILIAAPAQEVLVDLSKTRWPAEADIEKLNALAVEGLKHDAKGIFCYVETVNTVGETISVDEVPTIVCDLIGTAQSIVVPVRKDSPMLKKKTKWLLIGKHDPAQTFDLRAEDGSLKEAPLVRAKNLLGEPKAKPPAKAKTPSARRGRR